MGVCTFVASGLNFDVDRYLTNSPFKVVSIFRQGEVPTKDNPELQPRPDSGFVVVVNEDRSCSLASQQIEASLIFLCKHEKDLERLKGFGVDVMLLNFGVDAEFPQRSEYLPPDLIARLARFRMGLMFSVIQSPQG